MSYIEREKLLGGWPLCDEPADAYQYVRDFPAADVRPVVTCGECIHWERYENTAGCGYCKAKKFRFVYSGPAERVFNPITEPDFFCACGERGADDGTAD